MKIEVNIKKSDEKEEKKDFDKTHAALDEILKYGSEKEKDNFIDEVSLIRSLGKDELLLQLAEEASELAHAALKLRRAAFSRNPTPKSRKECYDALIEEWADVDLCMYVLGYMNMQSTEKEAEIAREKQTRWANRIKEARKNGSTGR